MAETIFPPNNSHREFYKPKNSETLGYHSLPLTQATTFVFAPKQKSGKIWKMHKVLTAIIFKQQQL